MRKCIAILLCLVGLAPIVGAACVVAKQDNKNSWVTHFEGGTNPGATSVSLSTNVGGTGLNVTAGGLIVIVAWCKPSCTVLSITKGAQTLANGQVQQTSVTADVSAVGQSRIFYILSADTTGTQDITFVRSGTANDGTEHQIAAFSFTAAGCSWSHGIDTAVASNLGTLNANAPSITAPGTLLITDTMMVGHTNTPGYGSPWAQTTWTPDNFSGLTNTSNGLSYMLPPSNVGTVANNVTEQSGTGPGWAAMLASFIPSQNHYISSSGSDTNNGTSKATPWAHVPGMPNCTSVCNSYSVQPGDQFILKGGESWLTASLPVSWNGSGNSSNRVVVGGLDQTWFTGASWTRPVFDCQATECGGAVVTVGSAAHYVTFDSIEIKNLKQITGSVKGMQTLSDNTTFSNNYIHAWSRSAGAADSGRSFGFAANTSNGEAVVANSLVIGNIVDGSDALNQDMFGGSDDAQQVSNNVFRFVCNGIRGDHSIVSGNLVENVVNCFSGDHSNLIFVFGPFNGSTSLWMYNNVVRNLTASAQGSEVFWMNGNAGCASCTSYAYNNVIYNNGGGGSGRGIDIGGHPGNTYGTYNIFNNTIETTGGACMGNGEGGPRSTTNIRNNHCISSSTLCDGAGTTCNNQGNNLSQTLVQANGQGYNSGQVYAYSPTDVADSTVNAGGNLTASCSGNVAALCNDTTYPAYDSVNHVVVMRTVLPRPASGPWDEGAFELSSTPAPSVSFNPTNLNFASQLTGTSSASQPVVLTNSGSAALTITSITATGDFSQTNNCPGSLGVAATCTINVTFTPTASGVRSGSISVADNAAGSPQTVALSGTGVTPTPTAILSAASIPFSNQSVGTTSGSQTISLSNTGTATLAIASIVVNGDFARTTTCGATLGVGLSCNISVTFTPTVAGLRNGTLTVTDNSGGVAGSTQTASLSGTGISAFKMYALGRVGSGRSFAFGRQSGMAPDFMAFLPVLWVNTGITTNDGICSSAPGGVYDVDKTLGIDFTADMSGLGAAFTEWLGNPDQWYRLKIPPGTNIHGSSYNGDSALISTPKKAGATKCLVVESTVPLPKNRIVCSHGLPGYGGTRNPGCTTDIGQMWKLVADSSPSTGNNNINFPFGSNHIVIRDAEITIAKGSAQSDSGVKANIVAELNGDHIGIERSYIHGYDPGDPGQPTGLTSATNANGVCTGGAAPGVSGGWQLTGRVNTSGTSVTWVSLLVGTQEKSKRFGMSFSDGVHSTGFPQATITINGVNYTISDHDPLVSDQTLTLATSAGTQTNVPYSLTNPMTGYEHGCGDDNRGVQINCDYCWLAYNYFEKIHWFGSESHAISSGFSSGPIKVVHNWVEPGSAGFFSGGGPANSRGGPTSNFEIRGNIFMRDLNYRFLSSAAAQSPAPPFGCGPLDNVASSDNCPLSWGIKNNIEFKTGSKFLIDGNMLDGVWADGQTGYLMLLTVKQDGGGYDPATGLPWGRLEDGRISNNWFRNGPQMVQLISRSLGHGNGNGVSNPLQRLDFLNNVFTNIGDSAQWGSPGNDIMQIPASNQTYMATLARAGGAAHAIVQPPRLTNYAGGSNTGNYQSVFDFNSITSVADVVTADLGEQVDPKIGGTITIANKPGWNGTFTITGVKFGSVTTPCTTGIHQVNVSDPTFATQPQPCIVTTGINAGTFGDTIIYTDNINHPGTATLCSTLGTCKTSVSGIQASIDTHWFRVTDMSVGDGVFVHNCTGGTNPTAFQVGSNSLIPAIAPTNPAGLDVYYANAGADDSSGTTCLLENGNGLPKSLNFSSNTLLSQKILALGLAPGVNAQTYNAHMQHNVFGMPSGNNAVLTCNSIGTQGTVLNGPGSCADQNTFRFNDNIMALRTLGQWPPIPATATPNVTPATVGCSGATADTTCLGFTGYMNGVTFPLSACTYDGTNALNCPMMAAPWSNNFSLSKLVPVATSPFFTEGANIPAMEDAFTRTKYVCPVGANCGSGPYSD